MSAPIRSGAFQAPLQHEVIKVPDIGEHGREELRQQCFDIRIAVFTHEQGFPLETEIDDIDEIATHFLIRLVPSLEPVGTIRAIRTNNDYKMGRLAVLKEYRKFRFGRALILTFHDWAVRDARLRGATPGSYVRCISHSQIPVKMFYVKHGYEPEGDEFDEDGAPHQKMVALLQIPSESN